MIKQVGKKIKQITEAKLLKGNRPDFLIIGAQKSGTTSLLHYLRQHPSLFSPPDEVHYFDKWIHHGYGLKWYENHFKSLSFGTKVYFEKTPRYIYEKNTPGFISEVYPGIKMILILRNPVQRAFSAWHHYYDIFENKNYQRIQIGQKPDEKNPLYSFYFENRDSFPVFRDAINIELEKVIPNGFDEPSLLRRGLYAEQLKNYYQYFDKDQILILGFKDFVRNTEAVLNRIYRFLNLPKMDYSRLKIKKRNKRTYKFELQSGDKAFLENFYNEPNRQLMGLIGKQLDW